MPGEVALEQHQGKHKTLFHPDLLKNKDQTWFSDSAKVQAAPARDCPRLAIVVPCYNEAAVLPQTISALRSKLSDLVKANKCQLGSFLLFVDDGSLDSTWELIVAASASAEGVPVRGLRLGVNAGHQAALLAGLLKVAEHCDAAVSIDADLQDDLAALDGMLPAYASGAELVLGVRRNRETDTFFKRNTAALFYAGMRWLGVDLVAQHADYRLMSRKALSNLALFPEYHLFLRGLQKRLHHKVALVHYNRLPRAAGRSQYSLRKMFSLAWNGVTSFSIAPLRIIAGMGVAIFLISCVLMLHALLVTLAGSTVPGWASTTIPLYAIGGLILLSLGVVGEYTGKIYLEVKKRPRYIIDDQEGWNE
ncbi:glycosyltransferase family 2 protein [Brucella sp. IR073]|uniref:glycosyltransferase family 2 protein n=1 Tax=unclassified Brucella TaxID=2632610 RepID=UPI003B97DB2A